VSDGSPLPGTWPGTGPGAGDRFELESGEKIVASCRFDLDANLRFADGSIVLTDRRLVADPPASADGEPASAGGLRSWRLDPTTSIDVHLRSAVGRIELSQQGRVVARWLFTPARAKGVHALEDAFDARGHGQSVAPSDADTGESPRPAAPAGGKSLAEDESGPPGGMGASWRALARVLSFARPHASMAILGIFLTLASTAAALVPPYLTMPLVDRVLIPKQAGEPIPFSQVLWYLSGLALAAILAWLLSWARSWTLAWVSERIAAGLRVKTYAHMQTLSLDFFSGKRTGDLMSRVGSDTDRINIFLSVNLIEFASDVMLVLLTAAVLIWINPWLALVTLAPFPLVVWLVYAVRKGLRRGFARASVAWADMTSVLADTIPGIRVVKAFAQEAREVDRFVAANDRVLDANDRVNVVWAFFGPLVSLFSEIGLLIVWAAGAWMVFSGSVTVGMLTAFLTYISRFYGRIESMIHMVPATQRAATSAQRIFDILDCQPTVAEAARPINPGRVRGRIEISNLHFRYGAREILHGIDLTIEPGEMIGLVGTSGSGLPTLSAASTTRRAVRSRSTEEISANCRSPPTAATSAACCRNRSCSSARSRKISPTGAPPTRPSTPTNCGSGSWRRPEPRAHTNSFSPSRSRTTRGWANAAARSREANGSGFRSHVPCSSIRAFSFSTRPPQRSTRRPRRSFRRRSTGWWRDGPRSPSPTVSPRSVGPIGWWCSTTDGSWRWARTMTCSPPRAPMPGSTTPNRRPPRRRPPAPDNGDTP
jgi:ATP-binding cassette subfamily B protein